MASKRDVKKAEKKKALALSNVTSITTKPGEAAPRHLGKYVTIPSERYVFQIMTDVDSKELKMPTESVVREGRYAKLIAKRLGIDMELNKSVGYRIHVTSDRGPANVKAGVDLLTRLSALVRDTEKEKAHTLLSPISEYFGDMAFDKAAQDKLAEGTIARSANQKTVSAQELLVQTFKAYTSGDAVLKVMDSMQKAMLVQIDADAKKEGAAIEAQKSKLKNSKVTLAKAQAEILATTANKTKIKDKDKKNAENLPVSIEALETELAEREPAYAERIQQEVMNLPVLNQDWEDLRKSFIKVMRERHLQPADLDKNIKAAQISNGLVDGLSGKPAPVAAPRILNNFEKNSLLDGYIIPRTEGQIDQIKTMRTKAMTVAAGDAGAGKTLLAVALGVERLKKEKIQIVVFRPMTELGGKKTMGYLPGDEKSKIGPYLRPVFENLLECEPNRDLLRRWLGLPTKADRLAGNKPVFTKDPLEDILMPSNDIQILPLAFLRGATLKNKTVIVDEAQNLTYEDGHALDTRPGENTKIILCGDTIQGDIPMTDPSGKPLPPEKMPYLPVLMYMATLPGYEWIGVTVHPDGSSQRSDLVRKTIAMHKYIEENKAEVFAAVFPGYKVPGSVKAPVVDDLHQNGHANGNGHAKPEALKAN